MGFDRECFRKQVLTTKNVSNFRHFLIKTPPHLIGVQECLRQFGVHCRHLLAQLFGLNTVSNCARCELENCAFESLRAKPFFAV